MPRPRKFDEAEVVDKAMQLFWEKGYRGTSPRDLMEATGLSKSSLYNTFGSKSGLFERALQHYAATNAEQLEQLLAEPNLRTALSQLLTLNLELATGPTPRACLVASTSMEGQACGEAVLSMAQSAQRQVHAVFTARLARGQADGHARTDRSAESLAWFIMNHNAGLHVLARTGSPREELAQLSALALDTILT